LVVGVDYIEKKGDRPDSVWVKPPVSVTVPLLEGKAVCAWCNKDMGDRPEVKGITHGICQECGEKLTEEEICPPRREYLSPEDLASLEVTRHVASLAKRYEELGGHIPRFLYRELIRGKRGAIEELRLRIARRQMVLEEENND